MERQTNQIERIARRTFLQGVGTLGLATALTRPARADEGRRFPMSTVPVYFTVFAGIGDNPQWFQYPHSPGPFRGLDEDGTLFDATKLVKSANGKVIYYDFHFTPDNSIVGEKRPYVMIHEDDGRYTSREQEATFEVDETPALFPFLSPGTWRAVGRDIVQLDRKGGELDWAITRVDFDQVAGDAKMDKLSLLYLIWRQGFGDAVSDENNPQNDIPAAVDAAGRELIAAGPVTEPTPLSDREAIHVADDFDF